MGKNTKKDVSSNSKTTIGNQSKISSFFRAGASNGQNASSSLFSNIGGNGSGKSKAKLSLAKGAASAKSKPSVQNVFSDTDDDCAIIPDTPGKPKSSVDSSNLSKPFQQKHPPSHIIPTEKLKTVSENVKQNEERTSVSADDVVPGTPPDTNTKDKSKTAKSRSFLSSVSEIHRVGPPLRKKEPALAKKIDTKTSSTSKLLASMDAQQKIKEDASKNESNFNILLADSGLDSSTFKSSVTSLKRNAPDTVNSFPPAKRISLGTSITQEERTPIGQNKNFEDDFCKEKEDFCDDIVEETERKPFHWKLKKTSKTSKPKIDDKTTGNNALNSKLDEDTGLQNILSEIKCNSVNAQEPQVFAKKSAIISEPKAAKEQQVNTPFDIDSQEADDALIDIMSELKETLTQQNKKSASKQKPPKSGSKPIPRPIAKRLNMSTNLNDSLGSSIAVQQQEVKGKVQSGYLKPVTFEAKENIEAEDSQDSDIDPASTKLCESILFDDDDSWMDDDAIKAVPLADDKTTDQHYDPSEISPPSYAYGRCQVKQVTTHGQEIHLDVVVEKDKTEKTVVLKGFWCDTHINEGDMINVISEDNGERIVVDDNKNFIVTNPDVLISSTSVVSSVHCMRRAVLNEMFKGIEGRNIYMLHGSIIHAFFQDVLKNGSTDPKVLESIAKDVVSRSKVIHEIYGTKVSEQSVLEEVLKCIPLTLKFIERHLPQKQQNVNNDSPDNIVITDITDIEENVWSPRYGIKGKIDLTVEVKIQNDKKTSNKVLPLELKTGRPTYSVEHKGQVSLYSMMLGDRRDDPHCGLLLYLKESTMKNIPANHVNRRGLVQMRNELAYYLNQQASKDIKLPKPITSEKICSRCPQIGNCTSYYKYIEKKSTPPGSVINTMVQGALSHLGPSHMEYYVQWCHMITLEMKADRGNNGKLSNLWTKTGWEREKSGDCFSGMVLQKDSSVCLDNESYLISFRRHQNHKNASALDGVGLVCRDNVVVSAENRPLIALTTGVIKNVTPNSVQILVDRDLCASTVYENLIFRLDKCDYFNSMATNFGNLSRLMEDSDACEKLRELVIERRPPQFELTLSKTAIDKVKTIFKKLNKPQKTAILKVLMCKDYVLIKGFPGTGKTSTIVALVRILEILGYSVLLTSYTHSAVDTILLKLKEYTSNFIRLGRVDRVHPDVQRFSAERLSANVTSVGELKEKYHSASIVATTCLGVKHVIFTQRHFDVCIVDEASQVVQSACLGPLFSSNKFVLVGDPLQLPPLVQSKQAREAGMSESLFARLDDTGGTYELNMQYRMNREIMRLSNELIYNGALHCGSDEVAIARLKIKSAVTNLEGWVTRCVSDAPGDEVIFLNTDKVAISETVGVSNIAETTIINHLVDVYVNCGVRDIGIIAPYTQQVRLLIQKITSSYVDVNTVDQYQGRDKQLILISFVKTPTTKEPVSQILQDERRLNVALTRAKHKLVMIGSCVALKEYPPLKKLFGILRDEQIIAIDTMP